MKKLTIALICMAVISCAIPMTSAGPSADYGDAPDNTAGQVFAYPGVEGQFPSLYDTANSRIPGRTGAHHLATSEEWLNLSNTSSTTTSELDALIVDLDFDENMSAIVYFLPEVAPGPPYTAFIATAVGVSASAPDVPRHLNVLIDRNRDGEWKDTSFGKEWVVANQIVGTEPGKTEIIFSKFFTLDSIENMWMRVTFTRTKINGSVFSAVGGWDGSAPSDGFSYGETEDINAAPTPWFIKHVPPFNAVAQPPLQLLVYNPANNKWEGAFSIDTNPRLVIGPGPSAQGYIKITLQSHDLPFGDLRVGCAREGKPAIVLNNMGIPNKLRVKLVNPAPGLPVPFEVYIDNPPHQRRYTVLYKVSTDPDDIVVAYYDELEFEILPMIESSDSSGNKKDTFSEESEVYAYGSGYDTSKTYDLYIVKDRTWTDGMPIPPYVIKTTVSTDADGNISPDPTVIWHSAVIGKYDIIVDVNGNGNYDDGIDPLDDADVTDAGFEVIIPTLKPIGLIALIGLLSIVAAMRIKKR